MAVNCINISFLGKFLIISMCKKYEIVDLLEPSTKYELLYDNVPDVEFSVGGLLQKSPIICGGDCNRIVTQDCVVIGQPTMNMKMLEKRTEASSVVLNYNTLWIVGGVDGIGNLYSRSMAFLEGAGALNSTEFIKLEQSSVKGPTMPFSIYGHSMIQYDEKSIYIIGGVQNEEISEKTWIVDPTDGFKLKEGPSLNVERRSHGCAKMVINGRTVLVVGGGLAGGFDDRYNKLGSVEILDPLTNEGWTAGSFKKK